MNKKEVYLEAIRRYGCQVQVNMLVEEIGELLQALNKYNCHRVDISSVVTEVADVRIMIEQLELMLNIHDDVESEMERKIARLKERMDKED